MNPLSIVPSCSVREDVTPPLLLLLPSDAAKDYFCLNRGCLLHIPTRVQGRLSPRLARVRLETTAKRERTHTPRGSAHAPSALIIRRAHAAATPPPRPRGDR